VQQQYAVMADPMAAVARRNPALLQADWQVLQFAQERIVPGQARVQPRLAAAD
jgi:hypothetical protein